MREHQDASATLKTRLRKITMSLPEVAEERAWVGTRWQVRGKNFAHVVPIADGWPPAYVKATGSDGPATVLTFRVGDAEHAALQATGHPYFVPVWWPDIAGVFLDANTDWAEIRELVVDSYLLLAPKKLRNLLS
jgi:hypothetical protein